MRESRNAIIYRCRRLIVVFIFLAAAVRASAIIDSNANGMSDVWEQLHNAMGIDPNLDSDGDGFPNIMECLAGTDPFNANSYPKIGSVSLSGTNFVMNMPSVPGKLYQLQSCQSLVAASMVWSNETSVIAQAGTTNVTFPAPANLSGKFFRVVTSDIDSDGDGLNDWEEIQLGLDPLNPNSNGHLDGNGQAIPDYQYAVSGIATQNVVSISATDPITFQPDPGQSATDLGQFTVTRSGFGLDSITVNVAVGGPGTGFAVPGVDHVNNLPTLVTFSRGTVSKIVSVVPLANTNLQVPVIAQLTLTAGSNYVVGAENSANVLIYPSSTANGTGLRAVYYTNASTTYSSLTNFNPTNAFLTNIDAAIDFTWTNGTSPNLSNGLYTVRWTGQIEPQYSETYYFDTVTDDGVKLWVNDQLLIDKWQNQSGTEWTNAIALQANTRYDIKMEYLQTGGKAQAHLSWYSASQPKQIIPSNRFYPTNGVNGSSTNAPSAITSPLTAVGFVGQPFSFTVTAANTPGGFTATNLPPGLTFNSTNGAIAGVPLVAGNYSMPLTASNSVGVGASVLVITIFDTGSSVVREVWTNAPGVNIADIPLGTPANSIAPLGGLDGLADFGDNYGERIRGYFIAPTTGNYYFWVAGSDSAQLWLSNDGDSVNKVLRAWVTPTNNPTAPGQNGTSIHQWNVQASQRSGWLSLVAGQKYYLEILHKAGVGSGDNWSVGWLQDPMGTNTTPAGVTPSYLVSRFYPPLPVNIPGTLYSANMLALPGINSGGVGSASLRLSSDGKKAVLNYTINNLSGLHVDHIYSDPYLNFPATLLFDIAAAHPQSDGSYVWAITPTGSLSTNDILEIIAENKCSIVIQTAANPAGEIGGHFTAAAGSQSFIPPPPPPAWTEDSANTNAAARFLIQATFGPSPTDIASVRTLGYSNWISSQFALPATHHLPIVFANRSPDPTDPLPSSDWFNAWWQNAVTAPDQLRQRVAFALSEIMVASESGTLQDHADALAYYYDTLVDNSFGNYRDLLKSVSLTPAMGVYLNMQGNDKGNISKGTHANENYAREINQLFSIGLNRLWPDGTLILSSQGNLVPTYNQDVISGFAQALTGWNYYQPNQPNGRFPTNFNPSINYTNPMAPVPLHHDLNAKLLLDNVTLPPALGPATNTTLTNFDYYCSQDLEQALDSIFYNQNVGPFICRQLIQRLVTSNPSRDYLYRVVQKFNDNGNGVRGDMKAVVTAILLDYEARSTNSITAPTFGKQREPLLRVTAMARALPAPPTMAGTYLESGTQTNVITTPVAHRLNSGDIVQLLFTDISGNPAPANQSYSATVTGTNTFTVNVPNVSAATYSQSANVITVTNSGHGLIPGNPVYLTFTSGGAISGQYQVVATNSTSVFTVATADSTVLKGNCLLSKIVASGFSQSGTNITVSCPGPHGMNPGDSVFMDFGTVKPGDDVYQVVTVPDATHFTLVTTNSANQSDNSFNIFPLIAPPLNRSGNVTIQWSTWNLGYTDNGSTFNLSQSPLSAATVFNFFFPNYEFPGALASAGLTTPEFQLTSDTSVALQMNFLEGGIFPSTGNNNTNGLSSFNNGSGAIVLDLGPWLSTNYTDTANLGKLVDSLNSVLVAGQLSPAAKTSIVNYASTLTYSTPPSPTQIRDRVRAVVHLITASPDFTIQK
jgi:uncharacterized protein DUF1800/PA14 domain-containing protein/putative Ig domain-containing protein/CHRD domain-containing protein/thrombospondin type 3 repeat protein